MKTIQEILDFVHKSGAQCVVVTKYGDVEETYDMYDRVKDHPAFLALGENRVKSMEKKKIPKDDMHFIGHIQGRNMKVISRLSSMTHSICAIRHAKKAAELGIVCLLEVNVSREEGKDGILPEDFPVFWAELQAEVPGLEVVGLSGMGKLEYEEEEKREEFGVLKKLRDQYIPGGMISAGTSADYRIALEEGVDVVRLGRVLWDLM